ncbi:formate dehydrogenase, alpha subunit [Acidimicrobium ferrooxidans DSM 10331]|uniref:Formate dehydrogenase, alpha subunit n=1 Tax=Acidimicrobium ferrooxidans (strain DSM 10331 / JCM 15462 / NBRC 103882 / ICP) TaxID=525909 RepID=C7LYF9_ACIFD|nr:formate dehydrogenase subunit alpha [Acidimicrobium ferrooxidans]ACU53767.1 formate dehydrogenase, alpha subunit [Acidimicrobium ferrooxidans DSM 10331]
MNKTEIVRARIDDDEVRAPIGTLLVELVGRDVPHVCYHPQLGTIGTCDTCLVEVDGQLARACEVSLREGMQVRTRGVDVRAARLRAAGALLANHELYCTVCDNSNGDCVLHESVRDLGVNEELVPFTPKPYEVDASHPMYRYDPSQCILCGRCVQACQEVQVNETLSIDWSLERPRVVWDGGKPAGESSCVSCGHCVSVCPCNALMEKSMLGRAGTLTGLGRAALGPLIELTKATEPAIGLGPIFALSDAEAQIRRGLVQRTKTVCTYCGVGCSFDVWTRGRDVLRIAPERGPANGISTCVKGKFGWGFVDAPDRLVRPLVRREGHFEEASWDDALDEVAGRLRAIVAEHGPDAVGIIASSKCSNEEAYLAQKLARAVIGTNNIDNCSRYCQSPATMGLWRTVGYGGDAGSISDIAAADLVVIVGSNTAESHPVIATRVKRAHKEGRSKFIVADLRRHEMAERADLFLRPRPGTDLVWLAAVTRLIIEEGLADTSFLDERVEGFDAYVESLAAFDLATATRLTGLSEEQLRLTARMIAEAERVCVLWAMGVTQHEGGSDTSTAISNLLLVTGNYGRPGTGAYPLRGHNNVQGASDFGAMPTYLPGYEPIADDEVRQKWSTLWGVEVPDRPGLDNHQMIDAIHAGSLRALVVIGEELGIVDANATYVQEALGSLELLVVADLFLSRTASFADVVLPAAPSLEKEGTFTNTERRIQRFYRAMDPLGEARADWVWLCDLANRLGAGWSYDHPGAVMAEAAAGAAIFAGVDYERLEGYASLQWPVAADGTDSPLLYTERFAFPSGRARLVPVPWVEPTEQVDDDFDLHLNNGRLLEHFHEGNMTYRTAGIAEVTPGPFVEVSEELAAERHIRDGALVRLVSRRGAVRVRALVTDRVRGHELYLPMNGRANEEAVNVLTSSSTDRATHTPAFKELAVRLEVLDDPVAVALPRRNWRYGQRTPQRGVDIAARRARPDYVDPTLIQGGRRRG